MLVVMVVYPRPRVESIVDEFSQYLVPCSFPFLGGWKRRKKSSSRTED